MEKATATPIEVNFDGKKRVLHPITINDFAILKQSIRNEKIAYIEDNIKDDKMKLELIRETLNKEINDIEVGEKLSTTDGICFLLWRALRDDSYTMEQVKDKVQPKDLEYYSQFLGILLGHDEKKPKKVVK